MQEELTLEQFEEVPKPFVQENADIVLMDQSIPEDLRRRFYDKELTYSDIANNIDLFTNIPLENFITGELKTNYKILLDDLGNTNLRKAIKAHPDVIGFILKDPDFMNFHYHLSNNQEYEKKFTTAVKKHFLGQYSYTVKRIQKNGKITYQLPEWLSSMNFQVVDRLETTNDLMNCDDSVIILNKDQRQRLDILGIDNIKKFEQETGFLTYINQDDSTSTKIFHTLSYMLEQLTEYELNTIPMNSSISYETFLKIFIRYIQQEDLDYLNLLGKDELIPQEYIYKYPQIFIDKDAPNDLKMAFYDNVISPKILYSHKEYIPYLKDKDLPLLLRCKINLIVPNTNKNKPFTLDDLGRFSIRDTIPLEFISEYTKRYGNEKCLNLLVKYGKIMSDLEIECQHNEIEDENRIEQAIKDAIYKKIINENAPYSYLKNVSDFSEKHPELFINTDELVNIPIDDRKKLEDAFYNKSIDPSMLFYHKEYIPYLNNKNLSKFLDCHINLEVPSETDYRYIGNKLHKGVDFIEEYSKRYGNEKCLKLIAKYGEVLSNITIKCEPDEMEDETKFEQVLQEAIYKRIVNDGFSNSYLSNVPDFVEKYPDIFINLDSLTNISEREKLSIKEAFYSGTLEFKDIYNYPELKEVLKDKNLYKAFCFLSRRKNGYTTSTPSNRDFHLLDSFGNEKFLELCSKYGRYIDGIEILLEEELYVTVMDPGFITYDKRKVEFEEIAERIEKIITERCLLGYFQYLPDDAPKFLKEEHPELFLSDDAPESLKNYFYNIDNNYFMKFHILKNNKDWLPYLEGKSICTSLIKGAPNKDNMKLYFAIFGEENGIKLGLKKPSTVQEMINNRNVPLMKNWYDKTGGKFIPDVVVMENFPIEEADKFLKSASNWTSLMKINAYSDNKDSRDAMLKLAYSFGVFDDDQVGLKKLIALLTDLPRTIDYEYGHYLKQIDSDINRCSCRNYYFSDESISPDKAFEMTIEHIKSNYPSSFISPKDLILLFESLRKETSIDFSKNIFRQLYRENDDFSYTLTINPQSCPKASEVIMNILSLFRQLPIVTPEKAHQIFGGFSLKYDPDFREFLLNNMDSILTNSEYASYISNIEKQFTEIKALNSNRTLTLDLAVSYVKSNKYVDIEVGNEKVAEVSAIAGYSQEDFNTLQQIYNYGKQRTFSSIPRVLGNTKKYSYELLRLDDPLAMAIGTLSDCCQEIGNLAEVCMEHSMVDKNGRVFVVKDNENKIVAQSWVWRNKGVLCFDNIEIPDRAFTRAEKEDGVSGRKHLAEDVYGIYKRAAKELIKEDEKVYKTLLDQGKITKEQYEGLRLKKVTAGLGFNDIATTLQKKSHEDIGGVSSPLPFEIPVKLRYGPYTSDSATQYILEEIKEESKTDYEGETLALYSDPYTIYTDETFTEKDLLSLEKLEIVTKNNPYNLDTNISEYADRTHLIEELANNYGLNKETTKVILSPNFAIIYDENDEKIRIGDLLYNIKIHNEQQRINIKEVVTTQISLALKQISNGKEIDTSNLEDDQQEIYEQALNKQEELDSKRGIHNRK